ncbi:MAG: restriction endonuclease subunit S, partial [Selenomonas noxia]
MTAQQLRKSILQMAVQGKLVPQDLSDEPAHVLLERIRAEKERLIKEKKIKKEKNPSVIYRGTDNLHYEKFADGTVKCIKDEIPFEIPESWAWCRLGMVSTYADSKKKIKSEDIDSNSWVLDLEDIEKGGELRERKIAKEKIIIGDRMSFEEGNILYSKLRPYLLKILVAPSDGLCSSEIVPFSLYGGIIPEYIVAVLKCPYADAIINSVTYGVKMPRVSTGTMSSLLVPLPSINEQQKIVSRLNEVAYNISQYGTIYQQAEELVTGFPQHLRKSILQYAVQGKLVPQNESDEPASVLLERIRAEKEELIKQGKLKKDKHESVIFRRDNSY